MEWIIFILFIQLEEMLIKVLFIKTAPLKLSLI